jgi:hypothetical protein
MLSSVVSGRNVKGISSIQDGEKRSCIQLVDGSAYLSEAMPLAEVRTAAFSTAKRQAVEMAKTYISSKTKVENFITEYDMIWSESEGAVKILQQKDIGVENNTRYHVWIKAEVEYSIRPKGQQTIQPYVTDKNAPLTVKVWTSKKHYVKGERIQVFIQGNRDFYARIVDINSNGDILQLLPNDFRKINFFEAGKIYNIPDTGDRFALRASPPYGQDNIVVYASEAPLGQVDMEAAGQGLKRYKGSLKSFATKTRGVMITPDDQQSLQNAEFYEGRWLFTTGR